MGHLTALAQRKLQAANWCEGYASVAPWKNVIPAKAGIQYAAASRLNHRCRWNTGSPGPVSAKASPGPTDALGPRSFSEGGKPGDDGGELASPTERVGILDHLRAAAGQGAGREP